MLLQQTCYVITFIDQSLALPNKDNYFLQPEKIGALDFKNL